MQEIAGYWWTRFAIQRALALIYLIAFLVAANQFRPLLGERGLLPAPGFLRRVRFRHAPSLFHVHYSDRLAGALAWAGVGLAAIALTGLWDAFGTPASAAAWLLLWALYLSFVNVGQTFYAFGWESLLLETGFLAVFFGASGSDPPEVVIWLLRWLLFRLMFGAGLIKLRGDPCWRDLTCLLYHYETQPMPNPLSWYFHRLPALVHKAGVLFTHVLQLVVPFGYFAPPPVRYVAGALTILFQGTLILSGNLSWLNHLTIILALSCFDDAMLGAVLPLEPPPTVSRGSVHDAALVALALLIAVLSVRPVRNLLSREQRMNITFDPLHLVNSYGAFGSVTRRRFEVLLEGTEEEDPTPETRWREYEFKGKPGDPRRRPPVVAPYHLQLDWLMWFAAMGPYYHQTWVLPLMTRLLEGDAPTLRLLARNPFPHAPPKCVRAQLYLYRFTGWRDRRKTGRWWDRTLVGEYLPPVTLTSVEDWGKLWS